VKTHEDSQNALDLNVRDITSVPIEHFSVLRLFHTHPLPKMPQNRAETGATKSSHRGGLFGDYIFIFFWARQQLGSLLRYFLKIQSPGNGSPTSLAHGFVKISKTLLFLSMWVNFQIGPSAISVMARI